MSHDKLFLEIPFAVLDKTAENRYNGKKLPYAQTGGSL